jgi:hypothetical protein
MKDLKVIILPILLSQSLTKKAWNQTFVLEVFPSLEANDDHPDQSSLNNEYKKQT